MAGEEEAKALEKGEGTYSLEVEAQPEKSRGGTIVYAGDLEKKWVIILCLTTKTPPITP